MAELILKTKTELGNEGFDAEQLFSVLETGFKGGVLGTDKTVDSPAVIKEFTIRLNEAPANVPTAIEEVAEILRQSNFSGDSSK